MSVVLNKDTKVYLSMFYQPTITAYDFFKLFFAVLYRNAKYELTRDLAEILYPIKKSGKYELLLDDIKFKSNGIHIYSNQIEDSIYNLQNVGLLGKRNPSFGKIIIDYNKEICDEIISSFSPHCLKLMESLIAESELLN